MNTNKLYRSDSERMIAGVCGGLAKFLSVDVSLIRLAFVVLFFLGGNGILIYLIMALIVPLEPQASQTTVDVQPVQKEPPTE